MKYVTMIMPKLAFYLLNLFLKTESFLVSRYFLISSVNSSSIANPRVQKTVDREINGTYQGSDYFCPPFRIVFS
jgi:hypothetical protein